MCIARVRVFHVRACSAHNVSYRGVFGVAPLLKNVLNYYKTNIFFYMKKSILEILSIFVSNKGSLTSLSTLIITITIIIVVTLSCTGLRRISLCDKDGNCVNVYDSTVIHYKPKNQLNVK